MTKSLIPSKPVNFDVEDVMRVSVCHRDLLSFLTVEANAENECHVTKDTSRTERGDDETQITSSLSATQSCYEEPQPSTSTSNLFNASSTSLIESASVEQDNPSTSGKGLFIVHQFDVFLSLARLDGCSVAVSCQLMSCHTE